MNKILTIEEHLKEIDEIGFTVIPNVISNDECDLISKKLDKINQEQIDEFGEERLKKFYEWGTIRALIEKDEYFQKTILNEKVYEIVSKILGESTIIHLQNGIVINPNIPHRQAAFHRDFEKTFKSDIPLSINAFWAIDDFSSETGGTIVVPKTHKIEWPSEEYLDENSIQINVNRGAVLIFDSRLIHKGGENISKNPRRALNHQYTKPFIKQQIDLTEILKGRFNSESKISQVLGFWSIPPKSVKAFRADPDKRSYRSGQE